MIFNNLNKRQDVKGMSQDDSLEEEYQKMYKKIARDFVHREDLVEILRELLLGLGSVNQAIFGEILEQIDLNHNINNAIDKAIEYRENLSKPKLKRKKYKDIEDE